MDYKVLIGYIWPGIEKMANSNLSWHMIELILTFCILMDFPIHIDTISMALPYVYLMVIQVEFSKS